MHEVSNSLTPYSYYTNSSTGTYHFDTDHFVDFTVYFALDSSWFEAYPQFSQDVYTFGFWSSSPGNKDCRIKLTIAEILKYHFQRNPNSILTYLCDDDDKKEFYRKRKFNGWFLLLRDQLIYKFDKEVIFDGKPKHSSVLIHRDNVHFDLIKQAYESGEMDVTGKFLD